MGKEGSKIGQVPGGRVAGTDSLTASRPERISRRRFLSWAIGIVLALLGAIVAGPLVVFTWPPSSALVRLTGWRKAIAVADITKGGITPAMYADKPVFIFERNGELTALSGICTHLGCIVGPAADVLKCPCHASSFDSTGRVLGGPAPLPLPAYDMQIREAVLFLKTPALPAAYPQWYRDDLESTA